MGRRGKAADKLAVAAVAAAAIAGVFATPANASVAHVVTTGETLSGIAAVNGLSTDTLAAFNGISADSWVYDGQTIQIPSADEAGATTATADTSGTPPASTPTYGLATISGPLGSVQLDATAASAWESMRSAALSTYGVDLYPAGPLSGYRTYDQQSYLYNLFLSGEGAPANPPGTSSHELGIAVDLADPAQRTVVDQIGAAYGWYGIQSEWWHVQYSG